jgi:hypothetical protein
VLDAKFPIVWVDSISSMQSCCNTLLDLFDPDPAPAEVEVEVEVEVRVNVGVEAEGAEGAAPLPAPAPAPAPATTPAPVPAPTKTKTKTVVGLDLEWRDPRPCSLLQLAVYGFQTFSFRPKCTPKDANAIPRLLA